MPNFASDNCAPVAPEILAAVEQANLGEVNSYGCDPYTDRAVARFRELFGAGTDTLFSFNGTGANVVALSCLLAPYEAVVAPASAHLKTDECGALERFSGSTILTVPTDDGKLRVDDLAAFADRAIDQHFVVPRAISISQSTEYGTVYTLEELRSLAEFAHRLGWYVHMDGARISNAAAALGCGLRECTRDAGVDVLTFGGTKNGLLFGEAVVFFDAGLHRGAAPFVRKQAMQLASKMRFISAQFLALLENERWLRYARHANDMTRRLERRVRNMPGIRITRPVECNAIFATLDRRLIPALQERFSFYVFDDALPEVRWMTHHATTPEDVEAFAAALESASASQLTT